MAEQFSAGAATVPVELAAKLEGLERQRKQALGICGAALGAFVLLLLGILAGLVDMGASIVTIELHLWLALGLAAGTIEHTRRTKATLLDGTAYREAVAEHVAAKANQPTKHEPGASVQKSLLVRSKLAPHKPEHLECVTVLKRGAARAFAVRLVKGAGREREVRAEGIFVVVDVPHIEGSLVWTPLSATPQDRETAEEGETKKPDTLLKTVKLKDEWFTTNHKLFASNKEAAARVSNTMVRAQMLALSEQHANRLGVAFVGNKGFAYLPTQKGLLDTEWRDALDDPARLQRHVTAYRTMLSLLDGLLPIMRNGDVQAPVS
ncbi:MAG: DUF3137 domain-containing protein [Candidatus Sericytochromatia bacterium]|nr:DUF3137 domain-containing protein [Candidatus Sericytochromatia bacterium]